MALLSALPTEIVIPVCAVIGIMFSLVPWWLKSPNSDNRDGQRRNSDVKVKHDGITKAVSQGVKIFWYTGCCYVGGFMVFFFILSFLILGLLESLGTRSWPCKSDPSNKCKPALTTAFFTAVSFLLGASISVLSGFLGMEIAIRTNASTALEESLGKKKSIAALWSSAVMGFFPAGVGLLGLYLEIILVKFYYGNDGEGLFEAITWYGLGASSMAFFLRASGGIYAKAADVCLHLDKDTKPQFLEPDQNPIVITNYVGDIVGDIAGVGADFFGSYVEPSYAALVVASVSSFRIKHDFTAMYYPLLISSVGILVGIVVCIITILIGKIRFASKAVQLKFSTGLMTVGIVVSLIAQPPEVVLQKVVKNWGLSLCVPVGLLAGLLIELVNVYGARRCDLTFSDANNVSVDLGSIGVPLFAAIILHLSSYFAATYGIIAMIALGMLSTISTRLAKDAYDRISDNTKRIARMARGDTCDDNPTANITRGFAINSAALVSIALFGAFVSHLAVSSPVDALAPTVMIGSGIGAWLASHFSTVTMQMVGGAGFEMAWEVNKQYTVRRQQHYGDDQLHDYDRCFKIATKASFKGMIGPGAFVMFAPLIVGTVFGVKTLSGLLAGAFGFVVKAGAWEYAKTLNPRSKKERCLRRLAKDGRTTGHSLKDTSVPPLLTLVQLMAVESLVLAPWFASHGSLLSKIISEGKRVWGRQTYLL